MSPTEDSAPASWLREPLLHFALLAGLLFALDFWATQSQKEQIVVNKQTIDYLIRQREDLELRVLSPADREETIDQYVVDEILYSEAYKRGLDRGDSRMRRNLIRKMRGLLTGEIDEPTDEQLRIWYEENEERFTVAESWALAQVFFSEKEAIPENLLADLNEGIDPASVGETRIDIGRQLPTMTKRQLAGMLGPENAQAAINIQDELWHGPFESDLGFHFLRVTGRNPPRLQPYEQVERYLNGEWLMAQTRKRVDDEVNGLRGEYDIIIEDTGTGR